MVFVDYIESWDVQWKFRFMYSNSREVTFSCVLGACTASLWNMRKGIASQLPWWRHQMETLSTLLAFCARNSPVTGEFPTRALCFLWSAPEPRVEQTNGDAGNLRRHRAHYDVMVMHRFWVTKEISSVRRSLNKDGHRCRCYFQMHLLREIYQFLGKPDQFLGRNSESQLWFSGGTFRINHDSAGQHLKWMMVQQGNI